MKYGDMFVTIGNTPLTWMSREALVGYVCQSRPRYALWSYLASYVLFVHRERVKAPLTPEDIVVTST